MLQKKQFVRDAVLLWLKLHLKTMQHMRESTRQDREEEAQQAAKNLTRALARWSDGTDKSVLTLDKRGIADKSMSEVIAALTAADASHQLRRLELRRNRIAHVGASLLSKWLRPACTIELLNLWDNLLGDKGTRELALALPAANRLRVLNLGSNDINDAGVDALAGV